MRANKNLFSLIMITLFFAVGCGVKGDPRPPVTPANIGRGKPSYKKVGKELKINLQQADEEEDDDEEL